MSGGNVEHVSCFLDSNDNALRLPRQSSPIPSDAFEDALSQIPVEASPYAPPPSPPVLRPSTTYPPPGLTDSRPCDASLTLQSEPGVAQLRSSSPDPDDFYRTHPHPPASTPGDEIALDSASPFMIGTSNSVAADRYPIQYPRVASEPTPLFDSHGNGVQYRSVSDSSQGLFRPEPAKSPLAGAVTGRARQASFKDLVNKFNNKVDEVLPRPAVTPSRSRNPSRAASPASPIDGHARARALSHRRETLESSTRRHPLLRGQSAGLPGQEPLTLVSPPPLRTQDLDPPSPADWDTNVRLPRPHPAGERLAVDTNVWGRESLGLSPLQRRGSEGTIPSPHPASLDLPPGRSPLTPTAWYLGRTPYLEEVTTGTSANSHRRARSDLVGNWPGGPAAPAVDSHMAIPLPLPMDARTPPESPHSKSRIPISAHRLGSPCSSSDSSPTAKTIPPPWGVRAAAAPVPLPPRGISRLPKPAPTAPRVRESNEGPPSFATSPLAKRPVTRDRQRHPAPHRGPLPDPYITADGPKKSAPLRSSRPRHPVSRTEPPHKPRSKVVETVSNLQRQINRDHEPRSARPRERRLPELGHVDFATRRQRIQQAFNRTVQENERKAEKAAELRRHAQAQQQQQQQEEQLVQQQKGPPPPRSAAPERPASPPAETESPRHLDDSATVIEDAAEASPEETTPPRVVPGLTDAETAPPPLRVDTNFAPPAPIPRSVEPLTAMDSPTLGRPDVAGDLQDRAPTSVSAVTPESTTTRETAFDPEPQTELSRQTLHESHRTLLSQIMQIRESSPSSSSCDDRDCSFSDNEDKESIPIMLPEDPLGCDASVGSSDYRQLRTHYPPHDDRMANALVNRWSISSWSSSLRNQNSTDDQCEGSGDDLSQLQPCTEDSEPATQSCSAFSSTPPSVAGDRRSQNLSVPTHPPSEAKPDSGSQTHPWDHSRSASLAKLGGWDSKRVTQLYFEELARGRGHRLPIPAAHTSVDAGKRADGRTDSLTDDPVLVSNADGIPSSNRHAHTASLILRDDWEHASPSIMDWMQIAAEESSPQEHRGAKADGEPTPRLVTPNLHQPCSGEANGSLGQADDAQSPRTLDAPDALPPLPSHEPPPPPTEHEENGTAIISQPLPPHPYVLPSARRSLESQSAIIFSPLDPVQSVGSSENSLQRLETTASPQAQHSSATSLVPSASEPAPDVVKSPSPEQRQLKKRRHVIKELVDTEYTFGRDMKVVDDIYKGTSSSCLDLSTEDVKILFANSDQVVQFSMAFQDTLKEAAKSVYVMPKSQRWSSRRNGRNRNSVKTDHDPLTGPPASDVEKDRATSIGRAFVTHVETMEKVYSDYLKNHDAANKKLQTLQRNPKVAIWLKECREWASDLTAAWDLDSLLVKPVQRILKYPLLLSELIDSTPEDHPDRAYLMNALDEVTKISVRINEMKKRADLVGQVVGRKRKESDVRTGLSKAFGRRTEKFRQQVGLSDLFEDKEYDALSQKFGDNFFQLQVVMRDAETYTQEAQGSMDNFAEYVAAIEAFIDVSSTSYSELEGKWRDLKVTVQDIMALTLPEHVSVSPLIKLMSLLLTRSSSVLFAKVSSILWSRCSNCTKVRNE